MRITVIKIAIAASLVSTVAYAGGSSGGGIPPAREQLEQILLSQETANAGLFTSETGAIDLGIKGGLDPSLVLSKNTFMSTSSPATLSISSGDFEALETSTTKRINAVTLIKLNKKFDLVEPTVITRSYNIEYGSKLGELILTDRRETMRNAVK